MSGLTPAQLSALLLSQMQFDRPFAWWLYVWSKRKDGGVGKCTVCGGVGHTRSHCPWEKHKDRRC